MANVFLLSMPIVGAGLFFGGVKLLDLAGLRSNPAIGITAIASVIAVFLLFKLALSRIQRR